MKLNFVTALLVFFCSFSFAQNLTIKGKLSDSETQLPVESATVYFSRVQDSTIVDYTISDKNGNFLLNVRKTDKLSELKVSHIIYENYIQKFEKIDIHIELDEIKLSVRTILLDSISIKFDAPPVQIKNDTIEFNASSFKVRPDANVEALLKELPGVKVSQEGKITVNGKEVNEVLVNGKPFFDQDGKVALKNLPADIINKVQVSETKTEEQKLTGEASTSENMSINLTIDEDKNKGYFGRILLGYGSDERYETSALLNYFEGDTRISLMLASNNVNSSGFSTDEIFDNMKGVNSVSTNRSGAMTVNGVNFGGSDKGITLSNVLGVNYSDNWQKKYDAYANYYFSDASTESRNKTKKINLLEENLFTTESESVSDSYSGNHNFNNNFKIKLDSTSTLTFRPTITSGKSTRKSRNNQFSIDETGDLLNESFSDSYSESDNLSFRNSIFYVKRFAKKGRSMNLSFENSNSKDNAHSKTNSATYFYQSEEEDDIRNQISSRDNIADSYSLRASYSEPITDSLKLNISSRYRINKTSNNNEVYNFDEQTDSYTQRNEWLSNAIWSDTYTFSPTLGFEIRKKKINVNVSAGFDVYEYQNTSLYLSEKTALEQNYVVPNLSGTFRYKTSKNTNFYVRYVYDESLPAAAQLLPVENLSNPLNTIIGNPDLELNKKHTTTFSYYNYDNATQSGYNFYVSGNYSPTKVTSISSYDENRKQTTTYTNVDDTYSFSGSANYQKTFENESEHEFYAQVSLRGGYSYNKGFTNSKPFELRSKNITQGVDFSYQYGELLTVNPYYEFTYQQGDYTNYRIQSTSNVLHEFTLETTSFYPENWVFGSDLAYIFNSNIASGFQKDFWMWNLSLAYVFGNKNWTAKVKVYDVLNQNTSNSRQISAVAITDTEDLILKRYVMFSLSYKLNNMAYKSKKRGAGKTK